MSREKKKEARFQSCKTSAQSNQKANWKKVGYQLFSFVLATFKSARHSIHEKQGVTWAKKIPKWHCLSRVGCRRLSLHITSLQPITSITADSIFSRFSHEFHAFFFSEVTRLNVSKKGTWTVVWRLYWDRQQCYVITTEWHSLAHFCAGCLSIT